MFRKLHAARAASPAFGTGHASRPATLAPDVNPELGAKSAPIRLRMAAERTPDRPESGQDRCRPEHIRRNNHGAAIFLRHKRFVLHVPETAKARRQALESGSCAGRRAGAATQAVPRNGCLVRRWDVRARKRVCGNTYHLGRHKRSFLSREAVATRTVSAPIPISRDVLFAGGVAFRVFSQFDTS